MSKFLSIIESAGNDLVSISTMKRYQEGLRKGIVKWFLIPKSKWKMTFYGLNVQGEFNVQDDLPQLEHTSTTSLRESGQNVQHRVLVRISGGPK